MARLITLLDLHPRLAAAIQDIDLHPDGTLTTTLGTPADIPGDTPPDQVHERLAGAPILITQAYVIANALQPHGFQWADTITTCTPEGILRITTPTTTYLYQLHPARLHNSQMHPNRWSDHLIDYTYYIARWVD